MSNKGSGTSSLFGRPRRYGGENVRALAAPPRCAHANCGLGPASNRETYVKEMRAVWSRGGLEPPTFPIEIGTLSQVELGWGDWWR